MAELFHIVSKTVSVLIGAYLVMNAARAVARLEDPAQRYGRMSLGLMGLGLLFTEAKFLLGGRMSDLTAWLEIVGAMLMLIGVVLLVRLFWKFPEYRNRSINLISFKP